MLPCGSSCGEINVISYQPFSIMPCMHLESYGDLNFKLRHIIYEGWSSPVHRQSVDHFKRLFENPQTSLLSPKLLLCFASLYNFHLYAVLWVKLFKVFPSLFQKYLLSYDILAMTLSLELKMQL